MTPRPGEALSLVERGWSGARRCSLDVSRAGGNITVTHLIKGFVPPSVLRLIEPKPGIRVVSVPRWWFRPAAWSRLLWSRCTGRLRWVLVDHERTAGELGGWCRRMGVALLTVRDVEGGPASLELRSGRSEARRAQEGYELWDGPRRVEVDAVFARG